VDESIRYTLEKGGHTTYFPKELGCVSLFFSCWILRLCVGGGLTECKSAPPFLVAVSKQDVRQVSEEQERKAVKTISAVIECALDSAYVLSSAGVQYHLDQSRDILGPSHGLQDLPGDMSCSEFAWWVYQFCGVPMGPRHKKTIEMVRQAMPTERPW
jgi:hypothetical protein